MRVLLIDNASQHIEKLADLFKGHHLTVIPYGLIGEYNADLYDLIVLSGGGRHSLIGNRHLFKKEMEFINKTDKPVIGICFGFELLAYIHGVRIRKLKEKIQGFQTVDVIDSTLKSRLGGNILVYEGHSWYISHCPDELIPLITSPSGIEAFKHTTKPHYGMQFHPEVTYESDEGKQVFEYIFSQITS